MPSGLKYISKNKKRIRKENLKELQDKTVKQEKLERVCLSALFY